MLRRAAALLLAGTAAVLVLGGCRHAGSGAGHPAGVPGPAAAAPAEPLALRAFVGYPSGEGTPPERSAGTQPPDVVLFADGLVVARDHRAEDGRPYPSPAHEATRLAPGELAAARRRLAEAHLERLPPRANEEGVGGFDQADVVIRMGGGAAGGDGRLPPAEVRAYALHPRLAAAVPGAFPEGLVDAARLLDELAGAALASGEPWAPDAAHPLPAVPGGPVTGG